WTWGRFAIWNYRTFQFALDVKIAPQVLQVDQKIARRLIAHVCVFGERFANDALQLRRYVFKREWFFLENGDNRVTGGVAGEGNLARQHFIEHNAEAPDVCACVGRIAARLFR